MHVLNAMYIPLLQSLQQILSNTCKHCKRPTNGQRKRDLSQTINSSTSIIGTVSTKKIVFYVVTNCEFQLHFMWMILRFVTLLEHHAKNKLCGVLILNALLAGSDSAVSSIYLAILYKRDDIKIYGYERTLEPLLKDLATLEHFSVCISQLGQSPVCGSRQSWSP